VTDGAKSAGVFEVIRKPVHAEDIRRVPTLVDGDQGHVGPSSEGRVTARRSGRARACPTPT
jgi:hypothetical protein